jgi:hypothetical protein
MTDKETPKLPFVHIEFEGVDIKVAVQNATPGQIWAACHMLEMFADDLYRAQHTPQPSTGIAVARTLDHLPKGRLP